MSMAVLDQTPQASAAAVITDATAPAATPVEAANAAREGSTPPRAADARYRAARPAAVDRMRPAAPAWDEACGLPDPTPLVVNLAHCVVEVIHGVRHLDQIARWLDEDVYRHVLTRSQHYSRARQIRKAPMKRPTVQVRSTRVQQPREGIAEASVVLELGARVRAAAIRLEWRERRWRATAIHIL